MKSNEHLRAATIIRWICVATCCVGAWAEVITPAEKSELLGAAPPLDNVVPALEFPDHMTRDPKTAKPWDLPIAVPLFEEHLREATLPNPEGGAVSKLRMDLQGTLHAAIGSQVYSFPQDGPWKSGSIPSERLLFSFSPDITYETRIEKIDLEKLRLQVDGREVTIHAIALNDDTLWIATDAGLFSKTADAAPKRHTSYGVDGPLSTTITGLSKDSKGTLWVGTPIGLSKRASDGTWTSIRGRDGLPYEDITCLAVDKDDRLWIGTSMGVIHYRPYASGRQWFYRQGKRYIPDDKVTAIAVSPKGTQVYVATQVGIGVVRVTGTTLLARAEAIEKTLNQRHRRLGLVAECTLDNAENPTSHTIGDNDNDGLWTAYHVAAMSLAYGATKDEKYKASAKEGMHALYMLQDASGIPGLVARSVLPPEEGAKKDPDKAPEKKQWRPTPDGSMYWKSDTSSDEIDGHFMAFYTYYEHIAQHDPAEKEKCIEQCREVIDYIVDNNYQLIDWDGERTRWGFWNPEALNGEPGDYIENGLNALQILSFLRTSHYVTGDEKYLDHYKKLIMDHHYLSNVLLSKKEWPDENNHSDDQLGHVAWYPLLQTEKDPVILRALTQGIRRHYRIVWPEKASFYTFVYATVDPNQADIPGAIENLMEIPTDRRTWEQKNSHRADVTISWRPNRFGRPVLTRALPADERVFKKWNADPYEPDDGGDGRHEDDGAAYLLPYWIGRYHGFIAAE